MSSQRAELSDHRNLITRVIMPVIYQDDVFGDSGDQFGLGSAARSGVLDQRCSPCSRRLRAGRTARW